MKINVGNMSFRTNDEELREVFSEFGTVASAKVVMDSETNRSRGFGFVEMPDDDEANAAISALNGAEVAGRNLRVNEFKPREMPSKKPNTRK
ncbi:MAG: RNA-binding protein [Zetaproteobacteria bacterium CG1_02_53_45]|nr:MAG: RNA-binding protein [Zetaproteobacteria bacterium CG1_02_53_45]